MDEDEIVGVRSRILFLTSDTGEPIAHIEKLVSREQTGPYDSREEWDPLPFAGCMRELPLSRDEAEAWVDEYLSDLSGEEQEEAIERLCLQ